MKESKAMLEIRKMREIEDKKMRKMSATEMLEYMKKRFKKNKTPENLDIENDVKDYNYTISSSDLYPGIVSEKNTDYTAPKKSD